MPRISTDSSLFGATIAELIIVVTVLGILTGMLFGPFNDLYNGTSQGLRQLIQTSDTRESLRVIERDVVLASKYLHKSNIDDLSGNIPGTSSKEWTRTGNPSADTQKRVLIIEAYGSKSTTVSGISSVRDVILSTSDCKTPLTINYVYFVNGTDLFRRTLKKTGSNTGCNGTIAQNRTCRVGYSNASNCQGTDARIVSGVKSFTVEYYADADESTPLSYTNTSALPSALTVVLSITTTSGSGANAKDVTSTMRITRLNDR